MFEDQSPQSAPPGNLPIASPPGAPPPLPPARSGGRAAAPQAPEPEDMFAGVEEEPVILAAAPARPPGALEAGRLKPKMPAAEPASPLPPPPLDLPAVEYATRGPMVGKIVLVVVAVLAVGGLAYGGFYVYRRSQAPALPPAEFAAPAAEIPAVTVPAAPEETAAATSTASATAMRNDELLFGEPLDSDGDGLDDVREREIGTNARLPDSDRDGLTDGDEVRTYKTNPRELDTDGDALADGVEVTLWRTDPLQADSDADGFPDGKEIYNFYSPLGAGKLLSLPSGVTTATVRNFILSTTTRP